MSLLLLPCRFEDAITAAKAYDKAAVYLYGASAITNFGLEACLAGGSESHHLQRVKQIRGGSKLQNPEKAA